MIHERVLCSESHLWPTIETSRNNRCMVKITYNGSSWYILLFTKHYSSLFFSISSALLFLISLRLLLPLQVKGHCGPKPPSLWVVNLLMVEDSGRLRCDCLWVNVPDVSNECNVFIFSSWGDIKYLVWLFGWSFGSLDACGSTGKYRHKNCIRTSMSKTLFENAIAVSER